MLPALGFQFVSCKMRRKFSKIHHSIFEARHRRPELQRRRDGPQKVYLRTKNSLLRAFLFIGVCFALASCFDKGDCLFTNTNVVKVGLKDAAAPATPKPVDFVSIHIPETGILYEDENLTTFPIVIDPRVTETKFVFQYGVRSDTLVLGYTHQTIVLSPDCGSFNYQNNLEVKYTTFGTDKVIIRNQRLLTSVTLNLEILL